MAVFREVLYGQYSHENGFLSSPNAVSRLKVVEEKVVVVGVEVVVVEGELESEEEVGGNWED